MTEPAAPPPRPAASPVSGPNASAQQAKRRSSAFRWLALLLVVFLIGVVAVAASPWWLPALGQLPPPWNGYVSSVVTRLPWSRHAATVPSQPAVVPVAPVQPAPTTPAPTPPAAGSLAAPEPDRLAQLEHQVDELRRQLPATAEGAVPAGLGDQLNALAERVNALEQSSREGSGGAALAQRLTAVEGKLSRVSDVGKDQLELLACLAIERAMAEGASYSDKLAGLRAAAAGDAALAAPLDILSAHAATGIATPWQLGRQLDDLLLKLSEPAPLAADAGFWDRVWGKLSGVVRVRRIVSEGDKRAPVTTEAHLASAADALKAGDLGAAVERVAALDGPDAQLVKPWLEAARARLDAGAALGTIEAHLADLIGQDRP